MDNLRNPKEAIGYLKRLQATLKTLQQRSDSETKLVSQATANGAGKVFRSRSFSLDNLDSMVSVAPQQTPQAPKSSSLNMKRGNLDLRQPEFVKVNPPHFQDGEFQKIVNIGNQYRQVQRLLIDLNQKATEWKLEWSESPHMAALLSEIDATRVQVRSSLASLRKTLTATAKTTVPLSVQNMIESLYKDTIGTMDYSKLSRRLIIGFPDSKNSDVVDYEWMFSIKGLVAWNAVVPHYIIVVTARVDIKNRVASYHLTTMLEYEQDHDIGASFKNVAQGVALLTTLMEMDRIDLDLNNMPFPDNSLSVQTLAKEWADQIHEIDLDKSTNRLFVRTKSPIPDDAQEGFLAAILVHIPEQFRRGRLRIDTSIEAYCMTGPVDRNESTSMLASVQSLIPRAKMKRQPDINSGLDFYVTCASMSQAGPYVSQLRATVLKNGGTVKSNGLRSVFSFAVGSGRRSDVRALRDFIEDIGQELSPKTVLKVRKALGV